MVAIASVAVRAVRLLFILFFHEIAPELRFGKAGDYVFFSFKVKVKK